MAGFLNIKSSVSCPNNGVHLTPFVLEKLFPGTKIDSTEVYIESVEAGSLSEKFLFKFCFKSEENFDLFLEEARKKLGFDGKNMSKAAFVIGLVSVAIILAGGIVAFSKIFDGSEPSTHIEANHNTIINIGAKELGMEPEVLKQIIESALLNKEQIAADAVKIIRPAKKDTVSEIVVNGDQRLKISNEAIKEVPDKVETPEDVEMDVLTHHANVEVFIRATDLDSKSKGWAAIVPSISTERMKMQINGNIDLTDLQARKRFMGDIILVEKVKGNEKKKVSYILENIADKSKFSVQMSILGKNVPN